MKKIILSIAWSAAELWLVHSAVFAESHGSGNVVRFLAGWNAIMFFPLLIAAARDKSKEDRPKSLMTAMGMSDTALTAMLAWGGWYWCALAFGLGGIASMTFRDREQVQRAASME